MRDLKIENKIKEITKLTDKWYRYVGQDHHKDHDCHWYIRQTYSYGEKPRWTVEHYGYIFDGGEFVCGSYEKALNKMLWLLKKDFREQKIDYEL